MASRVEKRMKMYSGELNLDVRLLEGFHELPSQRAKQVKGCPHNAVYRVEIRAKRSVVTRAGKRSEKTVQHVCPPQSLSRGIDDVREMKSAASAALSFAEDEGWPVSEHAAVTPSGSGWHVGLRPETAWPKEPARDRGVRSTREKVLGSVARDLEAAKRDPAWRWADAKIRLEHGPTGEEWHGTIRGFPVTLFWRGPSSRLHLLVGAGRNLVPIDHPAAKGKFHTFEEADRAARAVLGERTRRDLPTVKKPRRIVQSKGVRAIEREEARTEDERERAASERRAERRAEEMARRGERDRGSSRRRSPARPAKFRIGQTVMLNNDAPDYMSKRYKIRGPMVVKSVRSFKEHAGARREEHHYDMTNGTLAVPEWMLRSAGASRR